jgi:molybdenum cofactor cytidylyltransferase
VVEPGVDVSLGELLGVRERELMAVVGAGGKSTLVLSLGRELSAIGRRVVLTTTTKMGTDQIPDWALRVDRPEEVAPALAVGTTPFLIGLIDERKITGVKPEVVDTIYTATSVDYLLVEADGARRRRIKAPGPREPVIPSRTTLTVVVASLRAIGSRISDVAHRPDRVAAVLGTGVDHQLRPQDVAVVVSDPEGGLARVPAVARVVVALTGSRGRPSRAAADEIATRLTNHSRIDRIVSIPDLADATPI